MRLQLAALVASLGIATTAWADGAVSVRGAYYKERSTLVVQPMIDGTFTAGDAGQVNAHFLVDSITSASASTGAQMGEFTEKRYEVGFGYSHQVTPRLKLGADSRYSVESDYTSEYIAGLGELSLYDKNTIITVVEGRGFDSANNGVAVDQGAIGTPRREESLNTGLTSVGVSQLLGPRLVGSLTYDFMDNHGFQANIYRKVTGGAVSVDERVPDLRLRHAVSLAFRDYVGQSHTTVFASYRFYVDDWGVIAHTPEVRVVQTIRDGVDLRLRYRLHVQGAADFYKDVYDQAELQDMSKFVVEDEKLSAHHTQLFGAQLSVALGVFCVPGVLADARVDVSVERLLQSTSFGNAWLGMVGFTLPVAY